MSSNGVMDKRDTKEITNIDQKVRDAQVQLLYKQTNTGLVGALIVALSACVIFLQVVPQWKLALWAGIVALLTLVRGGIVFAFKKREPLTTDIDRWAKLHVIGVIVSGLAWGIPFIFLWPAEYPVYQMIWPIIIIPISAASVAAYYTWAPSYISFLVLTALPMSLRLFFEGGGSLQYLGFPLFVFYSDFVACG